MFKIKTVADIVSVFNKTIVNLDDVITERTKAIDSNAKVIQTLVASNGEHQQEIDNAAAVSAKLKAIFN